MQGQIRLHGEFKASVHSETHCVSKTKEHQRKSIIGEEKPAGIWPRGESLQPLCLRGVAWRVPTLSLAILTLNCPRTCQANSVTLEKWNIRIF